MTAFTWYGNQTEAEACQFGSLALIFPLIERMDVAQIINQHCPADPQAEYDYGTTLSLLMAARLYSPTALSNVAEWAKKSGADILWNIPPEKLNDDRLGRALDAFFEQRHSILAHLALHVAREFDVPLTDIHYDPTHILFTGEYENAQARDGVMDRSSKEEDEPTQASKRRSKKKTKETIRSDSDLAAAHITKGRATDDAPKGSQMVHAGICTLVDEFGPLPFFGHTVDGNQNGRTAVDEQLGLIGKHLKFKRMTMFSDRGTFSVGHLLRLKDSQSHAVCSAPWGEFKELFEDQWENLTWETASYLSVEQQRRRDTGSELPLERYELATISHTLRDDDSGRSIDCRVIFAFSTADQKVVQKHTPERVEALVFLLLVVLMLYYLLQRLYRQSVPPDASEQERRTTTATILNVFSSYCLLIHRTRLGREVQPTRLTTHQREILQQLGFSTPAQIPSQRLPRPPT